MWLLILGLKLIRVSKGGPVRKQTTESFQSHNLIILPLLSMIQFSIEKLKRKYIHLDGISSLIVSKNDNFCCSHYENIIKIISVSVYPLWWN